MNWSARSSVPINVEQLFNPAVTLPQEKPTSGFYSGKPLGVSDALSTISGLCLKLKASPTLVRIRSQLCAEFSLRVASTLHFLTTLEQSTRQASVLFPRLGFVLPLKQGRLDVVTGPRLFPLARLLPFGFVVDGTFIPR